MSETDGQTAAPPSIAATFGQGLEGKDLDNLCVNTIRMLAIDAVQKANSGHPGLPMGCADFAHVLWTKFLKFDPADPKWPDRDRFVLSAGHGSMLLYAMLHLTGYALSLDEIKRFRQHDSKTPGHPEFGITPGVDATTGPLGQGISNAVGMAIAERWLASQFNKDGHNVVDHFTYVLASDGDMMEGVSHESCALAGHLGLGKLVVFYDYNRISLDGSITLSYSDNVAQRFHAYNWHVQEIDGMERTAIAAALEAARAEAGKPSIIIGHTTLGFGSPNKANTHEAHGAALGPDEVKLTKKNLGWPETEDFLIPDATRPVFAAAAARGQAAHAEWKERLAAMNSSDGEAAANWAHYWSGKPPEGLAEAIPPFEPGGKLATRKSASQAQAALMKKVGNLIGGSADLASSTYTTVKDLGIFSKENPAGRNIYFGVREHAMGSILNGMCYHGGVRAFGGTFFTFSDYMRPAIRLAALSHLNPIYVFTHDSVYLGEDGPTHQPVEHLAALRSIPNVTVIRPADASEAAVAWCVAMENTHGPTALVLSRQNLATIDRKKNASAEGLRRGAYHVTGEGDLTIIASGSEVELALDIHGLLKALHKIESRVVSMPSWELFEKQSASYRIKTLGKGLRLILEVGVRQGWERYFGGPTALFVGLDRFGLSAPDRVISEKLGLTAGQLIDERILIWHKAQQHMEEHPAPPDSPTA